MNYRLHWIHYVLPALTLVALLLTLWIVWRTRAAVGVTAPVVLPARMGWRA